MITKSAFDRNESENQKSVCLGKSQFLETIKSKSKLWKIKIPRSAKNDLKKIIVVFALFKVLMELTGRGGP